MASRKRLPRTEVPESVRPTVEWRGLDELPIEFADYLHYRILNDRVYLSIGQLDLPVQTDPLPNSPIPLRAVTRLVLPPQVLRLWSQLLADAVDALPSAQPETAS